MGGVLRTQTPTDLVECQAIVERLEEERAHLQQENEHLREASRAFGDLAERLNLTLRAKRRGLTDQGPRR